MMRRVHSQGQSVRAYLDRPLWPRHVTSGNGQMTWRVRYVYQINEIVMTLMPHAMNQQLISRNGGNRDKNNDQVFMPTQ